MSDDSRKMGHVQDLKIYVRVLLALFVLTSVTVFVSLFDFGKLNDLVAMVIAFFKAGLVVLFFMHAKYEDKITWAFIYYPLIILGTLLAALFLDYGNRVESDRAVIAQPFAVHDSAHASTAEGGAHGSEDGAHGTTTPAASHDGAEVAADAGHETEPASDHLGATADSVSQPGASGATGGGWGVLSGDVEAGRTKAKTICIACHVIEDAGFALPTAPPFAESANLERITPEYLRKWFKNPLAVKPGTLMPNLNLSDEEIENLIAFLHTYKN